MLVCLPCFLSVSSSPAAAGELCRAPPGRRIALFALVVSRRRWHSSVGESIGGLILGFRVVLLVNPGLQSINQLTGGRFQHAQERSNRSFNQSHNFGPKL